MSGYRHVQREQALDFMADYPGFGEMRWYTEAIGSEQLSFSWRTMPPGTGGRESYGHRHTGREEIYFVITGTITFKVDDEVFEAGPHAAVLVEGEAYRSIHNDAGTAAELLVFSVKADGPAAEPEKREDFWPS